MDFIILLINMITIKCYTNSMISHAKKLLITSLILLSFLRAGFACGQDGTHAGERILRVIDGDTIEISGGDRIRLLGIDAPERGDPVSEQATNRLRELTAAGQIAFELCDERDVYGRLLATVRVDKSNVNRILLQEGMAVPMLIPPCGRLVAADVLNAAGWGARFGKGIYSLGEYGIISHNEAQEHIGKPGMVRGRILELYKGRKAWHFNFGSDWKTDFTAVMFREGQRRYSELGIDPADLVGSEVLVIGKIKRYNGAQIIIRGPDQVIPLEGKIIQYSPFKIQEKGLKH